MLEEELFDETPKIEVLESEYKRLLGYPPNHLVDGRSKELMDSTKTWYARHGRPWTYLRQAESMELRDGSIFIEGQRLSSKRLHDHYEKAGVQDAVIAVVSAGFQCEEEAGKFWKQGAPDQYYFMETYGSAVAEFLMSAAGHRICSFADQKQLAVLPHYSPGYSGWDIADQITMMQLVQKKSPETLSGRIRMLTSGMLVPKKSLVGLFGVAPASDQVRTNKRLIPCTTCALPNCDYRRKPYRKARYQLEQSK